MSPPAAMNKRNKRKRSCARKDEPAVPPGRDGSSAVIRQPNRFLEAPTSSATSSEVLIIAALTTALTRRDRQLEDLMSENLRITDELLTARVSVVREKERAIDGLKMLDSVMSTNKGVCDELIAANEDLIRNAELHKELHGIHGKINGQLREELALAHEIIDKVKSALSRSGRG